MSWPPCATPRSMSADSPDTPTSPPPNATTAGHRTPPSTPSSPHNQLDRRRSAPFHDLAMPLRSDGRVPVVVATLLVVEGCASGTARPEASTGSGDRVLEVDGLGGRHFGGVPAAGHRPQDRLPVAGGGRRAAPRPGGGVLPLEPVPL